MNSGINSLSPSYWHQRCLDCQVGFTFGDLTFSVTVILCEKINQFLVSETSFTLGKPKISAAVETLWTTKALPGTKQDSVCCIPNSKSVSFYYSSLMCELHRRTGLYLDRLASLLSNLKLGWFFPQHRKNACMAAGKRTKDTGDGQWQAKLIA